MDIKRAKILKIQKDLKAKLKIKSISDETISKEEELKRKDLEKQQIFYNKEYSQIYQEHDILGEGCVGQVRKVSRISDGAIFASKMVHTGDEEKIEQIIQEFVNCRQLNHPNIVKVFELYIDTKSQKVYTVMEFIKAKQMFSVIHRISCYNESIASKIFQQILSSIKYLHERGICHRDLKPNNILANEDGLLVKITDFNISKFGENKKKLLFDREDTLKMWTYTGTVAFTAPEAFEGEYNESVDMWSAGVVLYVMLSGQQPFESEYVKNLIHKIQNEEISYDSEIWKTISDDAKHMISRLLQKDPKLRMKPNEALLHPFITRKQNTSPLARIALNNMKNNLTKLLTKFTALKELGLIKNFEKRRTFGIFNMKQHFTAPMSIDSLRNLSQTTITDEIDKKKIMSRCSLLEETAEEETALSTDDKDNKNYKRKNLFQEQEFEHEDIFYSPLKKRYHSLIIHNRYRMTEKRMINIQQMQKKYHESEDGNNPYEPIFKKFITKKGKVTNQELIEKMNSSGQRSNKYQEDDEDDDLQEEIVRGKSRTIQHHYLPSYQNKDFTNENYNSNYSSQSSSCSSISSSSQLETIDNIDKCVKENTKN